MHVPVDDIYLHHYCATLCRSRKHMRVGLTGLWVCATFTEQLLQPGGPVPDSPADTIYFNTRATQSPVPIPGCPISHPTPCNVQRNLNL